MDPKTFDIICRHKEADPGDLNTLFESYGVNTLEATVPVVSDQVVEQIKDISPEQQMYATLALKTDAVDLLRRGRMARTRDRKLNIVGINGQTMISVGEQRSRSPTPDIEELDQDIEEYMKERKRLKAQASGVAMDVEEDEAWPEEKPVVKALPQPPRPPLAETRLRSLPGQLPATLSEVGVDDDELCTREELDNDLENYMASRPRK